MTRKNKKTAVVIVFAYVVLTCGLRMFLLSYSNSYNKLTEQKIPPASLTVSDSAAELDILGKRLNIGNVISADSRGILPVFLLASDELRAAALLSAFLAGQK